MCNFKNSASVEIVRRFTFLFYSQRLVSYILWPIFGFTKVCIYFLNKIPDLTKKILFIDIERCFCSVPVVAIEKKALEYSLLNYDRKECRMRTVCCSGHLGDLPRGCIPACNVADTPLNRITDRCRTLPFRNYCCRW